MRILGAIICILKEFKLNFVLYLIFTWQRQKLILMMCFKRGEHDGKVISFEKEQLRRKKPLCKYNARYPCKYLK